MPILVCEYKAIPNLVTDIFADIDQAFVSHFWELWPKPMQFMHYGRIITPDDWPKVISLATKINVRLDFEFR